jgi:hypothetical protein
MLWKKEAPQGWATCEATILPSTMRREDSKWEQGYKS